MIRAKIYLIGILSLLLMPFLESCKKNVENIGDGIIYMPQATTSGGVNNHYQVPAGGGEYTYNYVVEHDSIKIILGVNRSGSFLGTEYTVTLTANREKADEVINADEVENGIALPSGSFYLPKNIAVPNGEKGATTYLSIDRELFLDNSLEDANLVIVAEISNPSHYLLSEDPNLISTVIVINVNEIREII